MKRKWNRVLSWLLTLTMLVGSFAGLSLPVLADGEEETPSVSVQAITQEGFLADADHDGTQEKAWSVSVNEGDALIVSFNSAVLSGNAVSEDTVNWVVETTGGKGLEDLGFTVSENGNKLEVSSNAAVSGNGTVKVTASYAEISKEAFFEIVVNAASEPATEPDPVTETVSLSINATGFDVVEGKDGSSAEKAASLTISVNDAATVSFNAVSESGAALDGKTASWNVVKTGAKELSDLGFTVSENGNKLEVSSSAAVSGNGSFKLTASVDEVVKEYYFSIEVVSVNAAEEPAPEEPAVSKNTISVSTSGFDTVEGKDGTSANKALSVSVSVNVSISVSFNASVISWNEAVLEDVVTWDLAGELPEGLTVSVNNNKFTVSGASAVSVNKSFVLTASCNGAEDKAVYFDIIVNPAEETPAPGPDPGEDVFYSWGQPVWNWGEVTYNVVPTVTATFSCSVNKARVEKTVDAEVNKSNDYDYEDEDGTIHGSITWEAMVVEPDREKDQSWHKEYRAWYTVTYTISKNGAVSENGGTGMGGIELAEDIEIQGLRDHYEYTGAKIMPSFEVVDYSTGDYVILARGTDYTVSYGKNKEGTGTITVKGKGNYAGKNTKATFEIVKINAFEGALDLKGAKIDKISPMTYTGGELIPQTIGVKLKGQKQSVSYEWKYDKWSYVDVSGNAIAVASFSNNVNKGTATICLTGKDGSTVKSNYKINAMDISDATVSLNDIGSAVWAVKANSVWIDLNLNDQYFLINGQDYSAKFKADAVGTGAGVVTITGKGNFKGKRTENYDVYALDVDDGNIIVNAVAGKANKAKVQVVDWSGNAVNKKFYSVKVEEVNDGNAIEVTVTATEKANGVLNIGEGGFTKYVDLGSDFSKAKINAKNVTVTYTGNEIRLEDLESNPFEDGSITVTIGSKKNAKTLVYDTDFIVVGYKNNKNKGIMTVTLQGVGEYSGIKTFKVKIAPKKLGTDK